MISAPYHFSPTNALYHSSSLLLADLNQAEAQD
jgi:hypothetical protein